MSRAFDILRLLFEGPKQIDPATRDSNFQRWFAGSKVVDAQGNPLPVYHGTRRPDRIGNHFKASRATSGPMSFFTSDPEIAGGYATNKADTSLGDDIPYAAWFKYRVGTGKRALPLDQAWMYLSSEEQHRIGDGLARVTSTGEDGETMPDGQYRLVEPGKTGHMGEESWAYEMRKWRGNAFKAAIEAWIHSGTLFNDEESFMDVLKHAGVDMSRVTYDSPNASYPSVYKVYLSIKNPLDTSNIPPNVIQCLRDYSRGERKRVKVGVDMWHKAAKSGNEWMQDLENDFKQGTTHAWTSIPDWVTKTLRMLGYDGIKDLGGKYHEVNAHNVWIPFEENQIKSVFSNKGTYSGKKLDDSLAAGYLDALFEARTPLTPEQKAANAAASKAKRAASLKASAEAVDRFVADRKAKEARTVTPPGITTWAWVFTFNGDSTGSHGEYETRAGSPYRDASLTVNKGLTPESNELLRGKPMMLNAYTGYASPHEAVIRIAVYVGLTRAEEDDYYEEYNESPLYLLARRGDPNMRPTPARGTRLKDVWEHGDYVYDKWQDVKSAVALIQKLGQDGGSDEYTGIEYMHNRYDRKPGDEWWQKEVAKTQAGFTKRAIDGD